MLNKKTFSLLVTCAVIANSSLAAAFTDIADNYEYSQAIDFVQQQGIVNGYPDGTFKPYQPINRAELLKIIIEAGFENEFLQFGSESCFTDVHADAWYTKYVCFAKNRGIINGYPDGTFKPEQNINFVEALKITFNGLQIPAGSSDPWYQTYIQTAGEKKIIPLLETIGNSDYLLRGQMAELVTRIIKYKSGNLQNYLDTETCNDPQCLNPRKAELYTAASSVTSTAAWSWKNFSSAWSEAVNLHG